MPPGILVVEDNPDSLAIYRTILAYYGYEVIEAQDGREALRRAREEHPDAILMDMQLPVINGWEATRILKGDERTRSIPIIALTAHALAADRARAVEAGCDAYIAKPVEPQRVVEEVRRFIGPATG